MAHQALTPAQRDLIDQQLRLHRTARAVLGDAADAADSPGAAHLDVPYFAHMRIATGGRERDVLLGWRTLRHRDVLMVDWQSAPLAQVFFEFGEGDEYELELGQRVLSGTLVQRTLVGFERGELVDITTSGQSLSRRAAGQWQVRPGHGALLRPRPDHLRTHRSSPADVTLDEAQTRVVTMPAGRPVLVLGEAGCGKTTVALHRLAHLHRRATAAATEDAPTQEAPPFRAAVIVPSEGLRRFTRTMLDRLGIEAEVWLYDRWAAMQARGVFTDIPRRESRDASAGLIRLKRHPAVRHALAALARRSPELPKGQRARARRSDLLHLFGDRELLEQVRDQSDGALTAHMLAETLAHTKIQFSRTTEEAYAHVDADRLKTVDGRSIDDGTPMQDAGTIDVEDYAVLFELDRMRGRGVDLPRRYDCLVLDEAQELAPLELALIGRALHDGGSLIVAGDAGQQVDPSACFYDWGTTMAELGAADHDAVTLEVSYRCPAEVTALARVVREPEHAPRPDIEPAGALDILHMGNECHLTATLIDALRALRGRDPLATTAVICRTPKAARRMARLLDRGVDVRLALDGDFVFDAGINVTCVPEVKGLEFDYVVVPDASSAVYADDARSRNALYVAVTRPVHQLVLAAVGTWSPLLGHLAPARPSGYADRT